jgi:hypothetical protein
MFYFNFFIFWTRRIGYVNFCSSVFLECLIIFLIRKVKVATSLVGLERGVEGSVVLADGAAQRAAGGRVGGHLQQVGPRRVVRVYLSRRWKFLSFWKLDTITLEDKAAPRGAGLSEQEVAILIIGNLTTCTLEDARKVSTKNKQNI